MKSYSNTHETRIALLEQSVENINYTLIRLEKSIEKQFSELKTEIREAKKESRTQFWYTLTFIVALVGLPIIQNLITHFWSH